MPIAPPSRRSISARVAPPLLAGLSVLAVVGCATTESGLTRSTIDRTPPVEARSDALILRVDVDAWAQNRPEGLVPVWVEVENRGAEPVDLRYGAFRWVGLGDDAVGAMPAQQLAGAAALEALEGDLAPMGRVDEDQEDAPFVLQGSGPTDPTEDVQGGSTERVPAIDDFQHNYWDRFGPPTEDMYDQALREGSLAAGAKRSGFLYFPRAELDAARGLAVELAPESGGAVARVEASLR